MGEVRADPQGLATWSSRTDRFLAAVSLLVLVFLFVPIAQVAAGASQSSNALVERLPLETVVQEPRHDVPGVTKQVAVSTRHPHPRPRHRNKNGKRGRGKNKQQPDEQMTNRATPRHLAEQDERPRRQHQRRRQHAVHGAGVKSRGRGREGHDRGPLETGRGASQQIRHRKRRRRPQRKGVENDTPRVPAHAPTRHKTEEKLELVGRRTLEVLATSSTSSPNPAQQSLVVGILDLPAVQATTPVPEVQDWAITKDTQLKRPSSKSLPRVNGGQTSRGRKRADRERDNFADDIRPLDPDWLQRLLAAAAVGSARSAVVGEAIVDESPSPCERWLSCSESLRTAIQAQLAALPACPCIFPANVFYYNKIWDRSQGRYFRWRDASGGGERLDIYRPGATHCIRSLHSAAVGILSAQHCCYDRHRKLLTRGSGAGTPALVSPDVSAVLHDTLDVRPWRVCKGDFTRYNELRPPNNGNQCGANPDDHEFLRQTELSQFYR